ncbi:MAG: Zn-dependent hydrolase [Deltaproteobacteria bacterium]|nr:Zn-dependent hydrolase [Deltaproteobacteria bacterium]
MSARPRISSARLWGDLMELGKIGARPGGGIHRPALSAEDALGREWFVAACERAGLEVRMDSLRNVIARVPAADPGAKVLATGSHLDTVPGGGMFDGALGVLAGLECARAIKEQGMELPYHLEVINFTDEEGAYGAGSVGSRAMLGSLVPGELERVSPLKGRSFAEDLAKAGGDAAGSARRDAGEFAAFVELHIEQGSRLESEGIACGVVTAIVSIDRYEVTVTGEAGHAGTTPMHLRRDALVMAAPLFTLVPQWAAEQNPEMVATIGTVSLEPGTPNVIPGKCRFIIELRGEKQEDLDAVRMRLDGFIKDRPEFSVRQIYKKPGVSMHRDVRAAVEKAIAMEGCSFMRLPSGAGHDAHTFGHHVPTGMIFIPCRNGVSHNPDEWADREQAALGAQILLNTLLVLAGKA